MQRDFPRQLAQKVSPQQRLNLAGQGERFVEREVGDEEAEELGAEGGGEGGVLCEDGLWRGGCVDGLLEMCLIAAACISVRVGAGRWRGGVDAYPHPAGGGEHLARRGRGRGRGGGEGDTQLGRQLRRGGRRRVAGGGGHAVFPRLNPSWGEEKMRNVKSGKPQREKGKACRDSLTPRIPRLAPSTLACLIQSSTACDAKYD